MADIKKTLPPSVGRTNVVGPLLETVDPELERLESEMRAACRRLSVDSCDEKGASLWERETGIPEREGLPLSMRRARIRMALRERETCTPRRLKMFVGEMMKGETLLTERFGDYLLEIREKATDLSVPSLSAACEALRDRIPAHLAFTLAVEAALRGEEGERRLMHQAIRVRVAAEEEET